MADKAILPSEAFLQLLLIKKEKTPLSVMKARLGKAPHAITKCPE